MSIKVKTHCTLCLYTWCSQINICTQLYIIIRRCKSVNFLNTRYNFCYRLRCRFRCWFHPFFRHNILAFGNLCYTIYICIYTIWIQHSRVCGKLPTFYRYFSCWWVCWLCFSYCRFECSIINIYYRWRYNLTCFCVYRLIALIAIEDTVPSGICILKNTSINRNSTYKLFICNYSTSSTVWICECAAINCQLTWTCYKKSVCGSVIAKCSVIYNGNTALQIKCVAFIIRFIIYKSIININLTAVRSYVYGIAAPVNYCVLYIALSSCNINQYRLTSRINFCTVNIYCRCFCCTSYSIRGLRCTCIYNGTFGASCVNNRYFVSWVHYERSRRCQCMTVKVKMCHTFCRKACCAKVYICSKNYISLSACNRCKLLCRCNSYRVR